jgi:hypothetical protein
MRASWRRARGRDEVETAVRSAAQSIAGRFETPYPDFEDSGDDEEFLHHSGRLAATVVPFETVARLE